MKELSKKSPYWLPKDRFMELKYFVKQIRYFQEKYEEVLYSKAGGYLVHWDNSRIQRLDKLKNDPTAQKAIQGSIYKGYLDEIMKVKIALKEIVTSRGDDEDVYLCVITAAVCDASYDTVQGNYIHMDKVVPVSRKRFYQYLRYFYWYLDCVKTHNLPTS